MELLRYIQEHWDDTVRMEREGKDGMIGLPYEYYVPCMEGMFQELYYWDSFFTAKGLLLCGREKLVNSTVDNMLWLVEQFGYMPNGSHRGLLGRSQPPLLSEMVKDVCAIEQDKDWLENAYAVLCKEYCFWQERRSTACGLSRYGYNMENGRIERYAQMIRNRLSGKDLSNRTDEDLVENYMSDAESGWDFNPRCDGQQTSFAYVDLNSILYAMENNMAYFASELNNGEEALWQERAQVRLQGIRTLLYDGTVFLDYNCKTKNTATFSPVLLSIRCGRKQLPRSRRNPCIRISIASKKPLDLLSAKKASVMRFISGTIPTAGLRCTIWWCMAWIITATSRTHSASRKSTLPQWSGFLKQQERSGKNTTSPTAPFRSTTSTKCLPC